MAEDPPETPNYGFPLMSGATDDYVDLWHLILEDGSEETNNDGLIEPLDAILDGIETDVDSNASNLSSHENATTVHGSNGDVAGMNDLYTDSEAADAAPVQSVNGETGDVEVDGFETTDGGDYTMYVGTEEPSTPDQGDVWIDNSAAFE